MSENQNISFSSVETQLKIRAERMDKLKEIGVNPFEVNSYRDFDLAEVKKVFENSNSSISKNTSSAYAGTPLGEENLVTLAGRVKSKRVSGKIAFATLEDESNPEGFQFIFRRDFLPVYEEGEKIGDRSLDANGKIQTSLSFKHFKSLIDEGDYIQAEGYLDKSQRGEPSLFVKKFTILTKALRPLPEELDHENVEERYTNRVVDYKMNTQDENGLSVRDIVRLKNTYWSIWREEMQNQGFLEVECPIFEHIPGGAEAKPFTTFYNELDQDVFLRISLELPLKKLIAGGFEKVFEIGRIFRNEGSSPQHLQEYTQIEWYWAYADYTDGMKLVKKTYQRIVQAVLGKMEQVDYYGHTVNWGEWCSLEEAAKNGWGLAVSEDLVLSSEEVKANNNNNSIKGWPVVSYYDAIRYYSDGLIDIEGKNYDELMEMAKTHGVEVEENVGFSGLVDKIYKKLARVNIHNPIFLALVPVELEPLAKRNPQNPNLTERWQVVAGTAELGKCFSELNDPIDQFGRFEEQQAARDRGDEEAQFMDEDYVRALELGTPPMAGFGTSERFLSFLLGKHIKECVTFPHVKKQDTNNSKNSNYQKNPKSAQIIILENPQIPAWKQINTVAHLSASFAGREKDLFQTDKVETIDGAELKMPAKTPFIIKKAATNLELQNLKKQAEEKGLKVRVFTKEMQEEGDDNKVIEIHKTQKSESINYLGVLVYGDKKEVRKLTENFEMF